MEWLLALLGRCVHYIITVDYITIQYFCIACNTCIASLHWVILHYNIFDYITVHHISLHKITLYFITLHSTAGAGITSLHLITLNWSPPPLMACFLWVIRSRHHKVKTDILKLKHLKMHRGEKKQEQRLQRKDKHFGGTEASAISSE